MLLVYSVLVFVFLHAKRRVKSTVWLACSTICDIFCCGALLAIITILANFGLPTFCDGMGSHFTSVCSPEIYFYFVAIALVSVISFTSPFASTLTDSAAASVTLPPSS